MHSRYPKRRTPRSVPDALEFCLEHARDKRNLSVERVADRMGVASHWTLYKWLENGRLPAVLVRAFEFATGADHLSRFLAHSGGNLLIRIPIGRKTDARDIDTLQVLLNQVVGQLLDYRDGKASANETLATLLEGMEALGFRYGEISKEAQPELDFSEAGDGR